MANTTALKTIKNIVKKTLVRSGKDMSHYKRFYDICVDGLRDLRLNHVKEGLELAKFDVDQTLYTVEFPDDLIKFIGVGVAYNGQIWPLSHKGKINTTTTTTAGVEDFDSDIGEGINLNNSIWTGYQAKGGLNVSGYFVVDYANRRLMLRNFTGTQVWMYYVTSGISLTADTFIPIIYEPTLMSYILMSEEAYKAEGNPNLYERYKSLYDTNLRFLRKSQRDSLQEVYDTISESTYPTIKR